MENARKMYEELLEIRKRCAVPAISVGVIHQGQFLYDQHVGFRCLKDNAPSGPPTSETLYTVCSLSKTFVTAAFCLLVEEGKVRWTDSVKDYLPEFLPDDDPSIADAAFFEVLRHSSGIDNPVVTWLGPHGKVLITKDRFVELLNETRTKRNGKSLRHEYVYSNVAYGLVVLVIEKLSGMVLSDFIQERILTPLQMHHTAVTFSQVQEHDRLNNVAHTYSKLTNGNWSHWDHRWTDESNSPVLGMLGIRSSVKDMLIYISAIMEGYASTATTASKLRTNADRWSRAPFNLLQDISDNPLKGVQSMLDGAFWEFDCQCNSASKHKYRHSVPLVKVQMPCTQLSATSQNIYAQSCTNDSRVLGRGLKESKLAFVFNGVATCGTTSVKFFPETRSAVVAMASGLDTGDAAEFASLLVTQYLFDLQPHEDILSWVDDEVKASKSLFESVKKSVDDYHTAWDPGDNLEAYIGVYSGLGVELLVELTGNGRKLGLAFNEHPTLVFPLQPYSEDRFSFWPHTRDEWLNGGWLDFCHYETGLVRFKRDEDTTGRVIAAEWIWEEGAEGAIFKKLGA